jgi:HSP20 family protein
MIIRRDPFYVLDELSKLFSEGKRGTLQSDESTVESGNWVPAVDIKEEADRFILHVDVPGVEPDKIEVSMENNILTIKGNRETVHKEDEKGYHRIERVRGSFYRRFTLPDTANAEEINAKAKQGVLELTIMKKKAAEGRKIQVKIDK